MLTRRALLLSALAAPPKLRGIFPILQTPFTGADALDLPALAKQIRFCARTGVHGVVWPQLASEYSSLTREERLAGMETIVAAARGTKPAVVLGVQAPTADEAADYARTATRLGAHAIISLPPAKEEDEGRIRAYYKAIGEASPLPLFMQAVGKLSVEYIAGLAREIPTLRYLKDEAGPVHLRITQFRRVAPELQSFTGFHGKTLYEEMVRGSAGTMPAAGFGDLYASAWEMFEQGRRREAAEFCSRALLLITSMETWGIPACKYVLHLRGVFPNWKIRNESLGAKSAGFDDYARQAIAEQLDAVRPFLRA